LGNYKDAWQNAEQLLTTNFPFIEFLL
jgi:hypothetical protein